MKKLFIVCLGIFLVLIVFGVIAINFKNFKFEPKEYKKTTVEDLLKNPFGYEKQTLNVSGYLEFREVVSWHIIMPHFYYVDTDGDGDLEMQIGIQIIEKEIYIFHLHSESKEDSSYITLIEEYSGLYLPIFPLPFWYSFSFHNEEMKPNVIYPEKGFAIGYWSLQDVREHGKLWCLEC